MEYHIDTVRDCADEYRSVLIGPDGKVIGDVTDCEYAEQMLVDLNGAAAERARADAAEAKVTELERQLGVANEAIRNMSLLCRKAHKMTPEDAGRHAVRIAIGAGVHLDITRVVPDAAFPAAPAASAGVDMVRVYEAVDRTLDAGLTAEVRNAINTAIAEYERQRGAGCEAEANTIRTAIQAGHGTAAGGEPASTEAHAEAAERDLAAACKVILAQGNVADELRARADAAEAVVERFRAMAFLPVGTDGEEIADHYNTVLRSWGYSEHKGRAMAEMRKSGEADLPAQIAAAEAKVAELERQRGTPCQTPQPTSSESSSPSACSCRASSAAPCADASPMTDDGEQAVSNTPTVAERAKAWLELSDKIRLLALWCISGYRSNH